MTPPIHAAWLRLKSLSLRYHHAGESGPPVILLHGGGLDSALLSWRAALPALAPHFRVFTLDWPGYGESELPNQPYTLDDYAALLLDFMQALELPTATLAGISLGGGIALTFALAHPERLDRLVLVDSYCLAERMAYHRLSYWYVKYFAWFTPVSMRWISRSHWLTRQSLAAIFADPAAITPELVEEVFTASQLAHAGQAWADFQRLELLPNRLRTVHMARLGEITVPTLLIHGAKDSLVPLAAARAAAQRLPHARLEVIPNCGHWPQREAPEAFNRVILDYLTGAYAE